VDVVDWKTGPPTTGAEAAAAAVQLAVYRLAWHHLTGEPLDRIRASFHHVAANVTVRPADLLDEPGLLRMIRSVPFARQAPGPLRGPSLGNSGVRPVASWSAPGHGQPGSIATL
jgi:hypothetical protein